MCVHLVWLAGAVGEAAVQCECGCGGEVAEGRRFLQGHNLRLAKADSSFRRWTEGTEFGVHGTPIFGGIISEDFNVIFRDLKRAIATYDEMRRTDGTVQATLLALELPIVQGEWYIRPASQDPLDLKIAEFVRWNLFEDMTLSFRDFLRQALGMHWAGFSLFEKVFELKEFQGESFIGWRKFAQRLQNTISHWEFDAHGGPLKVYQETPNGIVEIPVEKLLIFTNRKEGGNVQGLSFLRAAYKHFYMKDRLYRLQAIGFERDVVGIPVASLPKGASKKDKAVAEKVVTSLRRDERAGLVKSKDWDLELLGRGASGVSSKEEAMTTAIRHHDMAIAKSILASIVQLGEGPQGSYALGTSLADLLTLAQGAQADSFADTFSDHAIRQLVAINWPGAPAPRLEHGEIRKKDVRQMSLVLSSLQSSGLLQVDPAVLAYVRSYFGIPPEEIQVAHGVYRPIAQQTEQPFSPEEIQAALEAFKRARAGIDRLDLEHLAANGSTESSRGDGDVRTLDPAVEAGARQYLRDLSDNA